MKQIYKYTQLNCALFYSDGAVIKSDNLPDYWNYVGITLNKSYMGLKVYNQDVSIMRAYLDALNLSYGLLDCLQYHCFIFKDTPNIANSNGDINGLGVAVGLVKYNSKNVIVYKNESDMSKWVVEPNESISEIPMELLGYKWYENIDYSGYGNRNNLCYILLNKWTKQGVNDTHKSIMMGLVNKYKFYTPLTESELNKFLNKKYEASMVYSMKECFEFNGKLIWIEYAYDKETKTYKVVNDNYDKEWEQILGVNND